MLRYILTLLLLASCTCAFRPSSPSNHGSALQAEKMTRSEFINTIMVATTTTITMTTLLPVNGASAKDDLAATKGTKADPAFQSCVSLCMYECTKPKADEQKSRQECLPECKAKCATTKAQLMIGTPSK
jgi:hypothetical protein